MKDLFDLCEKLTRKMMDKAFIRADVSFDFSASREVRCWAKATGVGPHDFVVWRAGNLEEVVAKFDEWIEAQPNPEQKVRQIFIRKVADAVDYGNEHGFEIAGLQTFHTNLLEAPR